MTEDHRGSVSRVGVDERLPDPGTGWRRPGHLASLVGGDAAGHDHSIERTVGVWFPPGVSGPVAERSVLVVVARVDRNVGSFEEHFYGPERRAAPARSFEEDVPGQRRVVVDIAHALLVPAGVHHPQPVHLDPHGQRREPLDDVVVIRRPESDALEKGLVLMHVLRAVSAKVLAG